MKIVKLDNYRNKEDDKIAKRLCEQIDDLKKIIKDGQLQQIVIQYDEKVEGEEANRHLIFWNENENLEEMIGFIYRLLYHITSLIGPSEEDIEETS